MNVKNKVIALVMSFVICFGTVSNSFANDKKYINSRVAPAISLPMLGVVSAAALGTGYAIKNIDDVYSLGKHFVNYFGDSFSEVVESFNTNVSIAANGVVLIGSAFLTYLNSFLDDTANTNLCGYLGEMPVYSQDSVPVPGKHKFLKFKYDSNSYEIPITSSITAKFTPRPYFTYGTLDFVGDDIIESSGATLHKDKEYDFYGKMDSTEPNLVNILYYSHQRIWAKTLSPLSHSIDSSIYMPGTLDNKKDENGDLPIYVPGNLGSLPGVNSDDVFVGSNNPPYELPNNGVVLPGTSNPSIDVDTSTTFPGAVDSPGVENPSVPSEGIWSTIKDFVVSLVVPSDTFWTDTFNGFRDNFSKNFPMLDMSKFDSLAVGGKPFPNLYAYGSKIVDGDVINSIVDWLRPIIAGFIMICLMFFNYRKIYKLIRNTEPFGGIAQGSSDFRTGLSSPPINNGLDPNPMGNLRDTLFDMRNEILRRENEK